MKHDRIDTGEPRPFVKDLQRQIEYALHVLRREGVLTDAVWTQVRAGYIDQVRDQPAFFGKVPPQRLSDALSGPGLDWIMIALLDARFGHLILEERAAGSEARPGSPAEAAALVVMGGLYLFAQEIDGISDRDTRDAVIGIMGAANEVLRGDHFGYLQFQVELTRRRDSARRTAKTAADAGADIRTGQAQAWYRNMGKALQPIIFADIQERGVRSVGRDRAAALARTHWPDPGSDGLFGFDGTFDNYVYRQAECPEHSTLVTAIEYLDNNGLLNRGAPRRGRSGRAK